MIIERFGGKIMKQMVRRISTILLSEDVKLKNLCKAMYMYGQAVKNYGK